MFPVGGAAEVDVLAEQNLPSKGPSEGAYTEELQHQKAIELHTLLIDLTTEETEELMRQFGERTEKAV